MSIPTTHCAATLRSEVKPTPTLRCWFYVTSTVMVVGLGLWARFTMTGLELVFKYLCTTTLSPSGVPEQMFAWDWVMLSLPVIVIADSIVMAVDWYFHRNIVGHHEPTLGACWTSTMLVPTIACLFALIGHSLATYPL